MDLQRTKIELAKLVLNLENEGLIEKIKNLLTQNSQSSTNPLSDQEKLEIKLGLQQLDAGDRVSLDEFLKRVS